MRKLEYKRHKTKTSSPIKFSVSIKCPVCDGGAEVGTRAVEFAGAKVGAVMCVIMLHSPGLQERSGSLVRADHVRYMV